jgi:hypothetical protein
MSGERRKREEKGGRRRKEIIKGRIHSEGEGRGRREDTINRLITNSLDNVVLLQPHSFALPSA